MRYESDMVDKAVEFYTQRGYRVSTEVPFLHRSIDMVYENNDTLIAIEFKRKNWKKAFEQARTHLYGSNKVYICILKPANGLSKELENFIEGQPIGLLFFDENSNEALIEEIYPASTEHKIWDIGEQWLKTAFNKRLEDELCHLI